MDMTEDKVKDEINKYLNYEKTIYLRENLFVEANNLEQCFFIGVSEHTGTKEYLGVYEVEGHTSIVVIDDDITIKFVSDTTDILQIKSNITYFYETHNECNQISETAFFNRLRSALYRT
jgi:hypothetical protein